MVFSRSLRPRLPCSPPAALALRVRLARVGPRHVVDLAPGRWRRATLSRSACASRFAAIGSYSAARRNVGALPFGAFIRSVSLGPPGAPRRAQVVEGGVVGWG